MGARTAACTCTRVRDDVLVRAEVSPTGVGAWQAPTHGRARAPRNARSMKVRRSMWIGEVRLLLRIPRTILPMVAKNVSGNTSIRWYNSSAAGPRRGPSAGSDCAPWLARPIAPTRAQIRRVKTDQKTDEARLDAFWRMARTYFESSATSERISGASQRWW